MKGREDYAKNRVASTGLICTAMMAPYHVKQAGRMNVMTKVDDGEEVVCGTLNVQVERG